MGSATWHWPVTGGEPLLRCDCAACCSFKVRRRVEAGSTVYADEAASWDALHARYETKRINHSFAFSDAGACTNQAESFFSRLRRPSTASITGSAVPICTSTPVRWRGAKPCAA